jgi:hypothetical protein
VIPLEGTCLPAAFWMTNEAVGVTLSTTRIDRVAADFVPVTVHAVRVRLYSHPKKATFVPLTLPWVR